MIGLLLLRRPLSNRSCGLSEASPIAVEFDMGSVVVNEDNQTRAHGCRKLCMVTCRKLASNV